MDTVRFSWALERFTGRRGACRDIFSDNGTNFVGADTILKNQQKLLIEGIKEKIIPNLADKSIQWHFNPPHSPSFGGKIGKISSETGHRYDKTYERRIINGTSQN